MPNLIDRRSYDAWSADGSPTLQDKARAKVRWILENHRVPPLDKDIQQRLKAVIEKAKKPMWGGETRR
jgi:trimethylamine:corrinoid methyltransferase-like protein